MLRHLKISAVLACCVVLFASIAQAKGPKYTDPAKTDADFAFQGEYRGEIDADGTKIKIGVQVIAMGEGKFRSVSYIGGATATAGEVPSSAGEILRTLGLALTRVLRPKTSVTVPAGARALPSEPTRRTAPPRSSCSSPIGRRGFAVSGRNASATSR